MLRRLEGKHCGDRKLNVLDAKLHVCQLTRKCMGNSRRSEGDSKKKVMGAKAITVILSAKEDGTFS